MRDYLAEQQAARVVKIKDALHKIGKFTITGELKEGANAYAFKAFHNNLQRDVFLKVYDYSEEANSAVLREPQILRQLTQSSPRCANIVEIYDIDVFDAEGGKYLCLQMEFVPTHSLLGALRTAPIGPQDAIRITLDILNGVSHFHTNSFVHRDLKPANILLCADGSAKITDLGSAANLPNANSMVTASRHSALYVPPEGWANPSTFGIRSDLYQVGMVFYELINGPLEVKAEHYAVKIPAGKSGTLNTHTKQRIPRFVDWQKSLVYSNTAGHRAHIIQND